MKYSKGDLVVYGSNGICRIDDIQRMTFPMETAEHTYYVLKPIASRTSTLFVPDHREELVSKMRYVLKKEEIDAILLGTDGKKTEWPEDKNQRANLFKSIMGEGKPEELLSMIRCIYERKVRLAAIGKKLPAADDNVLLAAEKLVRDEFAYSLNIPEDEVAGYISAKIEENK